MPTLYLYNNHDSLKYQYADEKSVNMKLAEPQNLNRLVQNLSRGEYKRQNLLGMTTDTQRPGHKAVAKDQVRPLNMVTDQTALQNHTYLYWTQKNT